MKTPILALNAADHKWVPPASREAFVSGYANAPLEQDTVTPQELGMAAIGHMDYFRPQAVRLWRRTLDWLKQG